MDEFLFSLGEILFEIFHFFSFVLSPTQKSELIGESAKEISKVRKMGDLCDRFLFIFFVRLCPRDFLLAKSGRRQTVAPFAARFDISLLDL